LIPDHAPCTSNWKTDRAAPPSRVQIAVGRFPRTWLSFHEPGTAPSYVADGADAEAPAPKRSHPRYAFMPRLQRLVGFREAPAGEPVAPGPRPSRPVDDHNTRHRRPPPEWAFLDVRTRPSNRESSFVTKKQPHPDDGIHVPSADPSHLPGFPPALDRVPMSGCRERPPDYCHDPATIQPTQKKKKSNSKNRQNNPSKKNNRSMQRLRPRGAVGRLHRCVGPPCSDFGGPGNTDHVFFLAAECLHQPCPTPFTRSRSRKTYFR